MSPTERPGEPDAVAIEPVEVSKPLKFTLKVAYEHPYLKERGIEPELAEEFGVGAPYIRKIAKQNSIMRKRGKGSPAWKLKQQAQR